MMNRTLMAGALAVALLSACSKPQPVAEVPRPVVVQKLALSPVEPSSRSWVRYTPSLPISDQSRDSATRPRPLIWSESPLARQTPPSKRWSMRPRRTALASMPQCGPNQ